MINFGDISKNKFLKVFSVLKTFWNGDELISKNIFDNMKFHNMKNIFFWNSMKFCILFKVLLMPII